MERVAGDASAGHQTGPDECFANKDASSSSSKQYNTAHSRAGDRRTGCTVGSPERRRNDGGTTRNGDARGHFGNYANTV